MKFFKFYERSAHGALLVFAGSYIKFLHKSLKLTGMFFCFVFYIFFSLAVLLSSGTRNEVFQVLWRINA